jgi:hypothetical protein
MEKRRLSKARKNPFKAIQKILQQHPHLGELSDEKKELLIIDFKRNGILRIIKRDDLHPPGDYSLVLERFAHGILKYRTEALCNQEQLYETFEKVVTGILGSKLIESRVAFSTVVPEFIPNNGKLEVGITTYANQSRNFLWESYKQIPLQMKVDTYLLPSGELFDRKKGKVTSLTAYKIKTLSKTYNETAQNFREGIEDLKRNMRLISREPRYSTGHLDLFLLGVDQTSYVFLMGRNQKQGKAFLDYKTGLLTSKGRVLHKLDSNHPLRTCSGAPVMYIRNFYHQVN